MKQVIVVNRSLSLPKGKLAAQVAHAAIGAFVAASAEAPAEGEVHIFPRNDRDEEVTVRYHTSGSIIQVDPWPFAVDSHAGYLVGYQPEGYPMILEPIMPPYQCARVARP